MSRVKPDPELVDLVLGELQRTLREIAQGPLGAESGKAPRYGYIEQTRWNGAGPGKGWPIAAWHITPDIVRPCRIKYHFLIKRPKVDGMFYDMLRGWFSFADNLSVVSINWQAGPRYGRGLSHRIGKDTLGRFLLDQGTPTWIS